MTHNQIAYWVNEENKRHNLITEEEIRRHNLATEGIDLGNLNESIRHNTAYEGETYRHNYATEGFTQQDLGRKIQELNESIRSHQANEAIGRSNVDLGFGNLSETQRHNENTEYVERFRSLINQKQVNADVALKEADTAYTDLQKEWYRLKTGVDIGLTNKKIEQIDSSMRKVASEIDLLKKNINYFDYQQALQAWDRINTAYRNAVSAVDAIIPG